MECNKDEALRSKSIAEEKLEKKDFASAKKFALKAQNLYPGLDGISQMLTTIDIYVSAENKINGEVDWYGVLGVTLSADEEIIRKQYRKLALMLHPDKNKSVGADGAFKLISEAWSLLSDKQKRLAYNQRRGSRGIQQKVPFHNAAQSAPYKANGYNFSNRTKSVPKSQNNSAKVPSTPTPTLSRTFWTICHRCKIHYEFVREYLNNTLLCPNCKKAFIASETDPPSEFVKSLNQIPSQRQEVSRENVPSRNAFAKDSTSTSHVQQQNPSWKGPGQAGSNSVRYANTQQVPLSRTANVGISDSSIAAKAANVIKQAQDKLKRTYTESNASMGWESYMKTRKVDDESSRYKMNYNMGQGNNGFGAANASGSKFYDFPFRKPNSTRDLTSIETRNMLMVKARKEILEKLNMWNSEKKEKEKAKESKKERLKSSTSVQRHDQNSKLDGCSGSRHATEASMHVPDPDFHDFDNDRTEMSFGDNEVWAAYDDDDGMPRFYALVSKVVSRKPFKLKISWLNSKTNSEFSSTVDWVSSGFYKTCGEFRISKYETCGSINSFSQKVNFSRSSRGSILMFPQKNDVWALYRNWSSDWNEHTPDDVIHKYDMVTVLDDYNEEQVVSVAPLVKMIGFKTVFRPNLDQEVIKRIPKEEMFRFSHRVPYHLLSGQEAQNAPKGCLELDPAATPLELLQVITEANEDLVVPDTDDDEDVPKNITKGHSDETNKTRDVNIAKIVQIPCKE